jgi:putative ABC transport system permease protein
MTRESARLWLRWSWRDLRQHWRLVAALALVISLGTGAYAGLGGTTAWRLASNDASYSALHMHDLRVRLPDGGFVRAGVLDDAVHGIAGADSVTAVEERLVVPTQVDASLGDRPVLVPGEIVGMSPAAQVDTMYVAAGHGLRPTDATNAVLESKFAADNRLPASGDLVLSGGHRIHYSGTGYTPEYFRITGRAGSLLGETGFAVVFLPLEAAQTATAHAGMVNDLVLRLAPDANRDRVMSEVTAAVGALGGTVTTREDDVVYRGLYADARNDQKIWNMFALLILLGAALAAFNLITRMIDSQRREVGVGMALGVSPWVLAVRPLLLGVQIAVLGVIAGLGVGWLMAIAMRDEMATLLPLPIWLTPFQTARFAQAALLGLTIPVVATVLPLSRIMRLQPVDAIRTGAAAPSARAGRIATLAHKVRLPSRSYVSMPFRNVLRAPRRTALTALGVAAAITCLVATLGLLDSFAATGDRSKAALEATNPDRLTVTLTTLYPVSATHVRGLTSIEGVAAAEPQLRIPTRLRAHGREIDAVTEILDLDNTVWTPTVTEGDVATAGQGILVSEEAASDLHVRVGDTVVVQHPVRTATGLRLTATRLRVSGLHANPLRPFTYLDSSWSAQFGLTGMSNEVTVTPKDGVTQDSLLRSLFNRPGVAAVEPTSGFARLLDYRLGQFTGILRVIEVATLLLALLIAVNTANLTADERARERATMLAFGLPPRTVTTMAIAESALIGVVGTVIGVGFGYLALSWIISGLGSVMPDISVVPTLFTTTLATTFVLGVAVVALAPLLNIRKQRRMDIPAILRVVE